MSAKKKTVEPTTAKKAARAKGSATPGTTAPRKRGTKEKDLTLVLARTGAGKRPLWYRADRRLPNCRRI